MRTGSCLPWGLPPFKSTCALLWFPFLIPLQPQCSLVQSQWARCSLLPQSLCPCLALFPPLLFWSLSLFSATSSWGAFSDLPDQDKSSHYRLSQLPESLLKWHHNCHFSSVWLYICHMKIWTMCDSVHHCLAAPICWVDWLNEWVEKWLLVGGW